MRNYSFGSTITAQTSGVINVDCDISVTATQADENCKLRAYILSLSKIVKWAKTTQYSLDKEKYRAKKTRYSYRGSTPNLVAENASSSKRRLLGDTTAAAKSALRTTQTRRRRPLDTVLRETVPRAASQTITEERRASRVSRCSR